MLDDLQDNTQGAKDRLHKDDMHMYEGGACESCVNFRQYLYYVVGLDDMPINVTLVYQFMLMDSEND